MPLNFLISPTPLELLAVPIRHIETSCLRAHVRRVNPQSVRWFPGHMRKGMNQINVKMSNVDVIVEIHDARIPFTGRSEFINKFGQVRPHILVMNKMDLAEKVDFNSLKAELMEQSKLLRNNLADVFFTRLNSPEKQKQLLARLIRRLAQLAGDVTPRFTASREFSRHKEDAVDASSSAPPAIMTMAVGIPNSGKSTLINALRTIGKGGGGKAARVGRLAGQTRSMGQPIIIYRGNRNPPADLSRGGEAGHVEDCRIMMLDTPGILEPTARSLTEQLSLCVCGAMDWSSLDEEVLVDYLLFWWNHRGRREYVSVLNLPGPTDNISELLARVCAQNSFFLPSTCPLKPSPYVRPPSWLPHDVESLDVKSPRTLNQQPQAPPPDFRRASDHILRLFSKGLFGRATFLPSDEQAAAQFFVPTT